jgi:hypothetical protein
MIACAQIADLILGRLEAEGDRRAIELTDHMVDLAAHHDSRDVRLAAMFQMARRRSEPVRLAMEARLRDATDAGHTEALDDLTKYLIRSDAPPAPSATVGVDDDGRPIIKVTVGPATHHPEEWATLVAIAADGSDAEEAELAASALLSCPAGKEALTEAISSVFERGDLARIGWIATRWIEADSERDPEQRDANPFWWRGLAHEDTGNTEAAIADFTDLAAMAPEWGYGHMHLARLHAGAGRPSEAAQALGEARRWIFDDPELAEVAALVAEAAVDTGE